MEPPYNTNKLQRTNLMSQSGSCADANALFAMSFWWSLWLPTCEIGMRSVTGLLIVSETAFGTIVWIFAHLKKLLSRKVARLSKFGCSARAYKKALLYPLVFYCSSWDRFTGSLSRHNTSFQLWVAKVTVRSDWSKFEHQPVHPF